MSRLLSFRLSCFAVDGLDVNRGFRIELRLVGGFCNFVGLGEVVSVDSVVIVASSMVMDCPLPTGDVRRRNQRGLLARGIGTSYVLSGWFDRCDA